MKQADLEQWVRATEKDMRTLEGHVKVLQSTQKFIGWVCGLLLTANIGLAIFVLHRLFELGRHLK